MGLVAIEEVFKSADPVERLVVVKYMLVSFDEFVFGLLFKWVSVDRDCEVR